jgi:uncharacterized protein YigE (DUF2233 family)
MVGTDGGRIGKVDVLRLDPARVDIQLRYDPHQPRKISEWFRAEEPLAALNAGFFDRDNTPVGLWTIDGTTYGRGHHLMQGEFRVSAAGMSIRRVYQRSETDGTRIIASVEAYPILILPGQVVNPCLTQIYRIDRLHTQCFRAQSPTERLVVGIDGAGHVLFVLAASKTFTLPGLATWLKNSDLNLDIALNLDGGSSAGMLVQAGGLWGEDSERQVPGAIIVRSKVLGLDGSEPP